MEKGGKGYTPLNRSSLKGKGDSSPRSDKVGRRVQFSEGSNESELRFSDKSGGKAGSAFSKGGKGDRVANDGKSPASKEPLPLELRAEQELPANAKCLTDSEAADILQGIQDQMVMLSKDPAIKIPVSFDRGLQYAKSHSQYTDAESARRVLDSLTKYNVSGSEICMIANVCPETVDEVFALLPSLKGKRSILSQPLRDALNELAKLKQLFIQSVNSAKPLIMGNEQSTNGRYHRLSDPSALLSQPLLKNENQYEEAEHVVRACWEKCLALEKETLGIKSNFSRLEKKVESNIIKLKPEPISATEGKKEKEAIISLEKEVGNLKHTIESHKLDKATLRKHGETLTKTQEKNINLEKKITEMESRFSEMTCTMADMAAVIAEMKSIAAEEKVTQALKQAGLESSNLIVGIDFTKSNEWTGARSFNNRSLHFLGETLNPYEQAISIIGRTLSEFDEDNLIPCYGFGDATTHDQDVFSFYPGDNPCHGFDEVLSRYRELVPQVRLAGPTSFAPIIETAIGIVDKSGGQYHVLVIIADGQVTRSSSPLPGKLSTQEQNTVNAIVKASAYPLSIVLVGVGDGPWDMMHQFDDNIPSRAFDNFQFVNFPEIMSKNVALARKEAEFALHALMEIPSQYKATLALQILGCRRGYIGRNPFPPPQGSTSVDPHLRSLTFNERTGYAPAPFRSYSLRRTAG
ncbi:hypothetical protein L6164_032362 [Bauhinia variegata]|uniref:Uncharacterized protein n=1 Tax=Bauhinia variegata TaxID=167791 RepID=A0ACB9KNI3_BAUVA|nr:hypothetical protein L6164_032362 [Bauhinia variegata]